MKLDSIREIKSHFLQPATSFALGVATPERKFPGTIALGITNGYFAPKLAVRCYGVRRHTLHRAFVDVISKFAHGEIEVLYLDELPQSYGDIHSLPVQSEGFLDFFKKSPPEKRENQGRVRPLKIGWSIGHEKVTAGTLGCFARPNGKKDGIYILSNNHVIANQNNAKAGDKILQPGRHDNGKPDKDTVAKLTSFVRLKKDHNHVDGAIALVNSDIKCDLSTIDGFGKYGGTSDGELDVGMEVRKFGRTTGNTRGTITAIEMDNVRVNYGNSGVLAFDNQIEIHGNNSDFSRGGDSGSLVMNSKNQGIGLLFAGGGSHPDDRTYANDLRDVLKELKINTLN